MKRLACVLALALTACQSVLSVLVTQTPMPTASPTAAATLAALPTSVTAGYTPTPPLFVDYREALPHGAILKLGDFRLAGGNGVRGIGWSADSRRLILGMGYGDVLLWGMDSHAPEMVITLAQGGATDLYWDDDRGILRTVEVNPELGGSTVGMYYGPSSEVLFEIPLPDRIAAWSPDGESYVIGVWDETEMPFKLIFKAYRTQQRIKLWERVLGSATAAVYAPDAAKIAFPDPSAGEIYLISAPDGESITTLFAAMSPEPCLVWSHDGKLIAVEGKDSAILVMNSRDGGILHEVAGRCAITFSPDGHYLAVSGDQGAIPVWDVGSGALITRLNGHGDRVNVLSWSPDGTMLASGALDGTLVVWDVTAFP